MADQRDARHHLLKVLISLSLVSGWRPFGASCKQNHKKEWKQPAQQAGALVHELIPPELKFHQLSRKAQRRDLSSGFAESGAVGHPG